MILWMVLVAQRGSTWNSSEMKRHVEKVYVPCRETVWERYLILYPILTPKIVIRRSERHGNILISPWRMKKRIIVLFFATLVQLNKGAADFSQQSAITVTHKHYQSLGRRRTNSLLFDVFIWYVYLDVIHFTLMLLTITRHLFWVSVHGWPMSFKKKIKNQEHWYVGKTDETTLQTLHTTLLLTVILWLYIENK